jgi:hypothetical protein
MDVKSEEQNELNISLEASVAGDLEQELLTNIGT